MLTPRTTLALRGVGMELAHRSGGFYVHGALWVSSVAPTAGPVSGGTLASVAGLAFEDARTLRKHREAQREAQALAEEERKRQSLLQVLQRRASEAARARLEAEAVVSYDVGDGEVYPLETGADEEYTPLPMEDAAAVLSKAGSTTWSTRAACFNELTALMSSDARRNEVAPLVDKITSLLLERLSDPHYKVVHAALDCTGSLAMNFPYAIEPHLERFLPQLLLRVQPPQEHVLLHKARDEHLASYKLQVTSYKL